MSTIDNTLPLSHARSALEKITATPEMKALTVFVLAILSLLILSVSAWAHVKVAAVYGTGAILSHSPLILIVPLMTSGVMTHILVVILSIKPSIQEPEALQEEVILPEPETIVPPPVILEEVPPVASVPIMIDSFLQLSPMTGRMEAIKCKVGDSVHKGQELFQIEAMKMIMSIQAQESGKIAEIFVNEGAMVAGEQALVRIEKHQE